MRPDQVEKLCMSCMTLKPDRAASCPGCGADLNVKNEQNQLPVGTVLAGKYLIGRTLGQGGFGITYIGMDLNLDLPVAIKEFFPGDLVTREQTMGATVMPFTRRGEALFPAGRDKFAEEARNLVRFDSLPGIVRARDLFYANNTAYIVMDYIDGKTLKRLTAEKGGKLDAAWLMEGLRPLIGSLEIIHATNLLHRDISPDNIMLDKDGSLKLLDFGSARQFSAEGEHSNTINVKHGYAPPEQYQTRGRQGAWTDIYSLCATIYKLTTGATPPQSLDRLTQDELLTPSALGARMTPRQEAAIMKGLSLRIEDRFQSVAELSAALYGQGKAAPSAGAQKKNAGAQYERRRAAETAAKQEEADRRAAETAARQKQKHEAEKAERKGINKAAVITICIIAALLFIAGVASSMSEPVSGGRKRAAASSAQTQESADNVQTQDDAYVEEFNRYRELAEQGDAEAMASLGNCYFFGHGVEFDFEAAYTWYKKSAELGDPFGQLGLGICYDLMEDDTEAFRYFKLSAEQGVSIAMRMVGLYYSIGCGVAEDIENANMWFEKAVDLGEPMAQYYLGNSYYLGTGVEQNYAEAFRLFTLSAEQENPWGESRLGDCYYEGNGTEQDYDEAFRLFSLAANQGEAYGQARLGDCYSWGFGTKQDDEEAIRLFTLSAEQGLAYGQYRLGECYYWGLGMKEDHDVAKKWWTLAAENGNADAQMWLNMAFD